MNDEQNFSELTIRPNFLVRVGRWLFPNHAYEWSDKRMEFFGEHPWVIHTDTYIYLDWKDRLRILVSGRMLLRASSRTSLNPGQAQTISRAIVLPPRGLE
jgi:hypothetical protein